MEGKLNKTILKRNVVLSRLKEIHAVGIEAKIDSEKALLFKAYMDSSEQTYNEFKSIHNQVIGFLSEEDEFAAQDAVRSAADKVYFEAKAIYYFLFSNADSATVATTSSTSSTGPKLPQISIPIFDGNFKLWPTFYDLYRSVIHDNDNLSNIEKFHYLIISLVKEPLSLVKTIPMTADNYLNAYESLIKRYHNKRHLSTGYYNEIVNAPIVQKSSSKELRHLLDNFNENLAALKSLQFPVDEWDFLLFNLLLNKLDTKTRTDFELNFSNVEMPSYKQLFTFLESQCCALESVQFLTPQTSKGKIYTENAKHTSFAYKKPTSGFLAKTNNPIKCSLCESSHFLYQCPVFAAKSVIDRFSLVKGRSLCINCLSQTHLLRDCKSKSKCRSCGKTHHSLLHRNATSNTSNSHNANEEVAGSSNQASTSTQQNRNHNEEEHSSISACTSAFCNNSYTVLLSTAEVDIRDSSGNFQKARVLFDSGSMANFISSNCLKRLGLSCHRLTIPIEGLNNMSTSETQGITNCFIKPRYELSPTFDFQAIVLPKICSKQPQVVVDSSQWSHVHNLKLADNSYHIPSAIDILIGAELVPYMFGQNRLFGKQSEPVAIETIFGWVLQGKVASNKPSNSKLLSFHASVDLILNNSLTKFWEVESLPNKFVSSKEDLDCEAMFEATVKRDQTGRFVVALPFRNPSLQIGESYSQATRRFSYLESRLSKNFNLRQEYGEFMKDYLNAGHMSAVPIEKYCSSTAYYIPHHCILKPDSLTTRLRVVFDASAKSSSGLSLNDVLLTGPKLQNDIFAILINFRKYAITFTCDIRQMYRQIVLTPEHRDYQRILWRFSHEEPIQEFNLNTVTYGVSSSPYLALRTLLQLAKEEGNRFPRAADVIRNNIYVDDVVVGTNSVASALSLQQELIELFGTAGFELRKWSSNHHLLLEKVLSQSQIPVVFDKEEPNFIKVLGLNWNSDVDVFSYTINPSNKECTKRTILSEIAKIYDPLGFITPVVLFTKNLLQTLWSLKSAWDDPPPQKIIDTWVRFKAELPSLGNIQIPRYIFTDKMISFELHGFSDASQVGYAAAIYVCAKHESGLLTSNLYCAKSKVAPVKTVSLPRLELLGTVLLADLMQKVLECASLESHTLYTWCDSEIVLAWLASLPIRWKTFVANRIAHVQETLPSTCWRYVPSFDNPADCASRGLLPSQLCNHSLWWHGPTWLIESVEKWPTQPKIVSSILSSEEARVCLTVEVKLHPLTSLYEKYSSFRTIQRIVAYMLRFYTNANKHTKSITGELTHQELHSALLILVKQVQQESFSELYNRLFKNQRLSKPLRKLALFIDDSGLIRVGGRLKESNLEFDVKHPVLIPSNHVLTNRIIENVHNRNLHPGYKTLHYLLMQQFWILSPRRAIERVISNCYRCFRAKPKALIQPMANLPRFRVNQLKAFASICLDYAGPFLITMSKHRGAKSLKAYVSVFVCCVTKAIHLELVSNLTSEAFLAAFQRFIARRGRCNSITSDQGTNFIGANKMLLQLSKEASTKLDIAWHFNAPSSPHFNGLAEAGVKSFKTHLTRILGDQILTYEEFNTLLTRIESILNSRPLCSMSSDPNDLQPLTPGHFLLMEPLNSDFPQPNLSHIPLNRLNRWQLLQRMYANFWDRWHCEYLHTLQQRSKWNDCDVQKLELNTLVLIKQENKTPNHWDVGRVIDVHPGRDGIIRVATVRTANGIYQRPIVKLCPLPSQ